MRKISLVLVSMLALMHQANAQDAVLSLSGDILVDKPVDAPKESSTPQSAAPTKAEDKGIFSFLNFFSKKNVPAVTVEAGSTETVLEKLIRTSKEGNVNSQLSLGYMYLYGEDGVAVDHKKAFDYYKMAAEQNDNVAINNLGSLYFSGIGTERNPSLAAKMFEKAAELGNTEAAVNLAFLYISGQGTPRNGNAAMKLFAQATEKGNPTAAFMLGYAYFKGYMVNQDYRKSFDLLRKSANAGYDDAQYQIAQMYVNGWGTPQNYGNAVKALKKAVEQGNVDAMIGLGNILAIGEKYPKDVFTSHILFNVASVRGAPDADNKRNILEKSLKIEELLQAQSQAEQYVEKPTELTIYIHQTFGENIRKYIDDGLDDWNKRKTASQK